MIFRQLFDQTSCTFTYLLASRNGGEALIIDPVFERVDRYVQLLKELDLKLVKVVDTHVHADHITGMAELRNRTKCITVMGENSPVDVVSMRVKEDEEVDIEGLALKVIYTPGHTSDSYSFLMDDRVFTGDTLLIRGTGRTDFQNGDPRAQYDSLFNKLLKLPDDTLVYPAHDYKGDTVTTIEEERAYNPRLQVASVDEYVAIMNNLNLANPKMMDVAVPANMKVGADQGVTLKFPVSSSWTVSATACLRRIRSPARRLPSRIAADMDALLPGCRPAPVTASPATPRTSWWRSIRGRSRMTSGIPRVFSWTGPKPRGSCSRPACTSHSLRRRT